LHLFVLVPASSGVHDNESNEEVDERNELLARIEGWLEVPMIALGLAWLAILVVELVRGVNPRLEALAAAIWIIFIAEFAVRLAVAPRRLAFLHRNWLTALALVLPALRVFRVFTALRALQVARATRGVRLVRIVTSLNRGSRALGRTMSRRGIGYVAALTALVTVAGAAGMYAFESLPGDRGLTSYGHALWWTAMLLTTIGSQYWPQTPEGRLLTLMLSAFSLGILGYITAALASFFVGRDAERPDAEIAGQASIQRLQDEISALRRQVDALRLELLHREE
jgi:voltage-gated potassium channel